jgi:hypothetical protein
VNGASSSQNPILVPSPRSSPRSNLQLHHTEPCTIPMYTPALILVALAVPLMVLARPTINIYSSIAAKFELVPSDGPVMKAVRSATVVTSGVLTATSYLNTTTCAGNPYAVEWVTLGYCGVYHANASDPAAPSLGCGNFVYTSAYTSTAAGYEQLYLDFNFYKDGACTVAGTPDSGGSCTRSVAINTTCTDHSVEGMTSSLIGAIETNFMLPEFGYTRMYVSAWVDTRNSL